ncbi:hypothetical protein FRC02_005252 [Tulasnella sp. 418]|nr:hypothetical protein FRC02_005252 [Tulasnella sp. 418]
MSKSNIEITINSSEAPPPLKESQDDAPCTPVADKKKSSLAFLSRSTSADNVLQSLKSKTKRRKRANSLVPAASPITPPKQEDPLDSEDEDLWESKGRNGPVFESPVDIEDDRREGDIARAEENKDLYRWAILYENQRGFTDIWSIPHYSSRTLLPNDPPPFTVPLPPSKRRGHASKEESKEAMKTPCSLRDYQLPDARWKWVSKHWMVDMRGDGEVSNSGFEYNWAFRSKGWRPNPGTLSAGGWVRRRRWVRLMVRPAEVVEKPLLNEGPTPSTSRTSLPLSKSQRSLALSMARSRSRLDSVNELDLDDRSYSDVSTTAASAFGNTWRGEVDEDWLRAHRVLKHFGRDGKCLEIWRDWLGVETPDLTLNGNVTPGGSHVDIKGKGKMREDSNTFANWNVVDSASINPKIVPDRDCVVAVLEKYGGEILSLFIFPSSRAAFLDLLDEAGINRRIVEDQLPRSHSVHIDQLELKRSSTYDDGNLDRPMKLSLGGGEKEVAR